jgi:hypothetical protein
VRGVLSIFVALATTEWLRDYTCLYCPPPRRSYVSCPSLQRIFHYISPITIQRLTSCYRRSLIRPIMSPPRPSTPPQFGPRPQCVHDTIFPTPSLANFLNNNIERVPIDRLGTIHQTCFVCATSMCDRLHYFQFPLCRVVPKPQVTQAHQEALRCQNARKPPKPLPSPPTIAVPTSQDAKSQSA